MSGISKNQCPLCAGITVRNQQESLSALSKKHCPEWAGISVRFGQEYAANGFDQPIPLPEVINNYLNPAHPYIAPDESYIIYDYNLYEGRGERNLLISYKTESSWTKPINLTEYLGITLENSNIPFVSFDGKYFFFSSNGNIYWADASFIEELRPLL